MGDVVDVLSFGKRHEINLAVGVFPVEPLDEVAVYPFVEISLKTLTVRIQGDELFEQLVGECGFLFACFPGFRSFLTQAGIFIGKTAKVAFFGEVTAMTSFLHICNDSP